MLPVNLLNAIKQYTLAQTATQKTLPIADDAVAKTGQQFELGQKLQGIVQAQVAPNVFKVSVSGQLVQMELPASISSGDSVALQVISLQPRLAFSMVNSATPLSTPDELGATSRMLSSMSQQAPEKAYVRATQSAPLWETPQPPESKQLAGMLQEALSNSGLFYESHQAQWLGGERTTAQLMHEPQNLPPEQARAAVGSSPAKTPVAGDTVIKSAVTGDLTGKPAASGDASSKPAVVGDSATKTAVINDIAGKSGIPGEIADKLLAEGAAAKSPLINDSADKSSVPNDAAGKTATPNTTADKPSAASDTSGKSAAIGDLPSKAAMTWDAASKTMAASGNSNPAVITGQPADTHSAKQMNMSSLPDGKSPGIPDHLQPLVQQQLNALETNHMIWQGNVWPGQNMQWEVHEQATQNPAVEGQRQWVTQIQLDLPNLGAVGATLRLNSAGLSLTLNADTPQTREVLGSASTQLVSALSDAGISVTSAQVTNEAQKVQP